MLLKREVNADFYVSEYRRELRWVIGILAFGLHHVAVKTARVGLIHRIYVMSEHI